MGNLSKVLAKLRKDGGGVITVHLVLIERVKVNS